MSNQKNKSVAKAKTKNSLNPTALQFQE